MSGWEHCKMVEDRLIYLGTQQPEEQVDHQTTESAAWDVVRDGGWELVAVVNDPETGELVHYFKRPRRN